MTAVFFVVVAVALAATGTAHPPVIRRQISPQAQVDFIHRHQQNGPHQMAIQADSRLSRMEELMEELERLEQEQEQDLERPEQPQAEELKQVQQVQTDVQMDVQKDVQEELQKKDSHVESRSSPSPSPAGGVAVSSNQDDGNTKCNFTVFPSSTARVTGVLTGGMDQSNSLGSFTVPTSYGGNITIDQWSFMTRYQGSLIVEVDLGLIDLQGTYGLVINCDDTNPQLSEMHNWAALDCTEPTNFTIPSSNPGGLACGHSVPHASWFSPAYHSSITQDNSIIAITLKGSRYIMFRAQWTGLSPTCPTSM